MKDNLIGWLLARGITLANDANDQTVLQAVQKAITDAAAPVTTLANEKETLSSQITALGNEKTALAGQVTTLTNERDTPLTARKTERAARIESLVDLAITRGKITVAERAAHVTTLANCADEAAFTAAVKLLESKARVIRTIASVNEENKRALANDMSTDDCRKTHLAMMEKHMKDTGETDPVKAHQAIVAAAPQLAAAFQPGLLATGRGEPLETKG